MGKWGIDRISKYNFKKRNVVLFSALALTLIFSVSSILLQPSFQDEIPTGYYKLPTTVPIVGYGKYYNDWAIYGPFITTDKAAVVTDGLTSTGVNRVSNAKFQTFSLGALQTSAFPQGASDFKVLVEVTGLTTSGTSGLNIMTITGTKNTNWNFGPQKYFFSNTAYELESRIFGTNPLGGNWQLTDFTGVNAWNKLTKEITVGLGHQTQQNSDRILVGTFEVFILVKDTTPPVITRVITGTEGDNGWYTSAVTVTWTVSDPESGVAPGQCPPTTVSDDTAGQLIPCSATNGAGLSSSDSVIIKKDSTPPTITAPADITEFATSSSGKEITDLGTPTVSDNMSPPAPTPIVTINYIPSGNIYPIGTTTLTYTATDDAGNDATDTQDVIIENPHPTTVKLRPISDVYGGDRFTVTGELIDDDTGTGIPGQIVKFTGSGAGTLVTATATTSGFTVADDSGIVIDGSPSDYVLRLSPGAIITIPSEPIFVSLSLKDMGTETVDVTVTNGAGGTFPATGFGQGDNIGVFGITDPNGISSIEIDTVTGGGTAGITRVETLNLDQTLIIDEEFAFPTSLPNPQLLEFAQGTFFAEETAALYDSQNTPLVSSDLVIDAYFEGAPGYLPSVSENCQSGATPDCQLPDTLENVIIYSIFFNTQGGFGGASGATEVAGASINRVLCGTGNDNDGDSLCNNWEGPAPNGVPIGNTGTNYNLPGSDPNRKDVYVEVDYMTFHNPFVSGVTFPASLPNDAIEDVMLKFIEAPVTNPTLSSPSSPLTNGIVLHVDQGEELAHDASTTMWSEFNSLKTASFGTPSERSSGAATLAAKAQAYRYVVFVHSVGGASGVAEQRGNDAVIALGDSSWGDSNGDGHNDGTRNQQAGTFMHELGHLLNLNHGGPTYLITDVNKRTLADTGGAYNCKPNHDSVMSYSRQLPNLLVNNWLLNFADGGLPTIRETSLVETAGNLIHTDNLISPAVDIPPWIIWGTPTVGSGTYLQQQSQSGGTPANINWAGDGSPYSTPAAPISRDINNFGFYGCQASSGQATAFTNYNEWTNLDYNFRQGSTAYFDSAHATDDAQELDDTINNQLDILSASHQDTSPWNGQSYLTTNAGANIPIKVVVYDGQGIPLVAGDAMVTYKVFKEGNTTPIDSGPMSFETVHWHADYPSEKRKNTNYYIQIIVSDIDNVVHSNPTKDPDNNPQYKDGEVLMSMKFRLT